MRDDLIRALLGGLTISSAEYLKADSSKLIKPRLVYVGSDEEVQQVQQVVAAGDRPDDHKFALHGSTQRVAHALLHASDLPFVSR